MLNKTNRDLILASSSKARFEILKNAGVVFHVYPANIDETIVKTNQSKQTVKKITQVLAETK